MVLFGSRCIGIGLNQHLAQISHYGVSVVGKNRPEKYVSLIHHPHQPKRIKFAESTGMAANIQRGLSRVVEGLSF
jgi:hypothetical protein